MSDKFLTTQERDGLPPTVKREPFCVIRHQSATVPVYAGEVHGRTRYTIAYFMEGRRQRRMFTDLDDAKREAKFAAEKIQLGLQATNDLRPAEREAYLAARRRLKGLDMPLLSAIDEYVTCRQRLGDVPLLAAVEEFLRHTKGVTLGVPVAQVCTELIASRKQDRVSNRYQLQLSSTLGMFTKAFPGPIMNVKSEQIDRWLRETKLSPVTRNNRLTIIRLLFNFAKQRNYLSKSEETEADGVAKVKPGATDTEIFAPVEMRTLLLAAPLRLIPLLAIGGFTGLRAAELSRLDWKAVNLERLMIELRAGQAKTASRRMPHHPHQPQPCRMAGTGAPRRTGDSRPGPLPSGHRTRSQTGHPLAPQCPASLVHQLPGCPDPGRQSRRPRSRQLPRYHLQELPGVGDRRGCGRVVWHYTSRRMDSARCSLGPAQAVLRWCDTLR